MGQFAVRSLVAALAISIAGAGFVQASAPGNKEKEKEDSQKSSTTATTVTDTEIEAKLVGVGTQVAAKGYAESKVITVTNTATKASTTRSFLTMSVKSLTLVDGSIVTFQLNGNAIGTGSVKSGRAKLSLSSKKGDTVPAVGQGDTLSVVDPDGTSVDLTGTFGAAQTETETSGK